MSAIKCRLRVRMVWWWKYYAFGVAVVAVLMNRTPDPDKVSAMAIRAARVEVLPDGEQ
ncbi:hypothetical protein D3C71_2176060 [compost metagenome]